MLHSSQIFLNVSVIGSGSSECTSIRPKNACVTSQVSVQLSSQHRHSQAHQNQLFESYSHTLVSSQVCNSNMTLEWGGVHYKRCSADKTVSSYFRRSRTPRQYFRITKGSLSIQKTISSSSKTGSNINYYMCVALVASELFIMKGKIFKITKTM